MRTPHLSQKALIPAAIVAAILAPACSRVDATPAAVSVTSFSADQSPEGQTLAPIAEAFLKFHEDTGGWPYGEGVWTSAKMPGVAPGEFTAFDTALFVKPTSIQACGGTVTSACWNGPYLTGGKSLADPAFNDRWGRPHLFAFYRPWDHNGGATITAPEGAVLLWSRGADGVDQVGCTEGRCYRDDKKISVGQLSVEGADDVLKLISTSTK